jgi:hypothetical protein
MTVLGVSLAHVGIADELQNLILLIGRKWLRCRNSNRKLQRKGCGNSPNRELITGTD